MPATRMRLTAPVSIERSNVSTSVALPSTRAGVSFVSIACCFERA